MADTSVLPANHTALLYATQDDFLATVVPFVQGGIDAGEGVIAVAIPENLRALRDGVGLTPSSVRFVDSSAWYSRPLDTMGRWVSFALDQLAVGRPGIRIVGEVLWPEDPLLQREMRRYETAATVGFDVLPTHVVCAYRKARYPRDVIEAVLATHPGVIENEVASLSTTYIPAGEIVGQLLPELEAPRGATTRRFEPFDVLSLADLVERAGRRVRIDEHRVQQLVFAASELASNAFAHAHSAVLVTLWLDGGSFVCQLEDEGEGIDDPAVGYQPPYGSDGRWGLWLARRGVDLLEVGRGRRGTAVRLVSSCLETLPRSPLSA